MSLICDPSISIAAILPIIIISIAIIVSIFIIWNRRHRYNGRHMDLNAMTTFRSLLLGVVNNKRSFLQNEDVTCFYQHASSGGAMRHQISETDADGGHRSTKINDSSSRLKSIYIDHLPGSNFTVHPYSLNSKQLTNNNDGEATLKSSKKLLVLFAWLFAKERHLDKYRKLYIEQGFDVITIKVNVKDFMLPTAGSQQIAMTLVRYLHKFHNDYDALIFHAFSVGAYQMGEVFVALNQNEFKEAKNSIGKILKGLIYDSAADINEAPLGLSRAATNNRLLQWAIMSLMYAHFRCCHQLATRHYLASSRAVHENEFNCPALVFISKDDDIVNYQDQLDTANEWRKRGIKVTLKCWDNSPHVSHFFKHPDEYRSLLLEFLDQVIINNKN